MCRSPGVPLTPDPGSERSTVSPGRARFCTQPVPVIGIGGSICATWLVARDLPTQLRKPAQSGWAQR